MSGSSQTLTSRVLRGVALSGAVIISLVILLGVIFWDADFHAARDRYEHMKLALFGDWQAKGWCPPGRAADDCKEADTVEEAQSVASDFTFFRRAPIDGTTLEIITGTRFNSIPDVIESKPASGWCYLSLPSPGGSQQIELGKQSAEDPPVYVELSSLDESGLIGFGLTAEKLTSLARSHCQFDEPQSENL